MAFRAAGRLLVVICVVVLAACEPEATPFPVDIPTPSAAPRTPDASAPVRYALAANTAGILDLIDLPQTGIQVVQPEANAGPDDLVTRFDVIVTYGTYPDATPAPAVVHTGLLVNTTLPPLDNPMLADIVMQAVDPAQIAADIDIPGLQVSETTAPPLTTLRAALANAGWPDGLNLRLAHNNQISVGAIQARFEGLNILLSMRPLEDAAVLAHLNLVTWLTPEERDAWEAQLAGQGQLIPLFSLPVSYWAVPGVPIRYSPQGWPLPDMP